MKTLKKMFAMLLAVVMVMGLSVTAFADTTDGKGSITISNAAVGETYNIYKVFDLTYVTTGEGDDAVTSVAYTFTKTESNTELYNKLVSNASPFTLTASAGNENVYVVTLKEGKDAENVVSFFKNNVNLLGTATATKKAEYTGTEDPAPTTVNLTFSDLDLGYYYITSTLGTVVTIDSTTPDVTVIDKNEAPTVDKQVEEDSSSNLGDSNTAGIGDTVTFRSEVLIPAGTVKLVLHDAMTDGLTLDADSIKVYKNEYKTVELETTNYTVKTTELTDGCDFEISFADSYLESIINDTYVYVFYTAKVNENAVIDENGNSNETHLSYGDSQETASDTTKTYVFDFDLHKYANEEATGYLANAEFVLSYTEGTGDDAVTKYATFSEITSTTGEGDDAVTTVVGYKLTGWVDSKETATRIVTNDSTAINIKGLDAGTYALTEVKAPDGYNLLDADVTVVINEDGTVSVNNSTVTEVTVQNQSGTELPSTGGIGTTIFYVVGSILVIGAAVLLITKKRMSGAEK